MISDERRDAICQGWRDMVADIRDNAQECLDAAREIGSPEATLAVRKAQEAGFWFEEAIREHCDQ